MRDLRVLFVGVLSVAVAIMSSCGQTYHLQSITINQVNESGAVINGTATIDGIGSYGTFVVKAQLSNGQIEDVTTKATWHLDAPTDLPSDIQTKMLAALRLTPGAKNQIQLIDGVCNWVWNTSDGKNYSYATDPLTLTVTYEGMTAISKLAVSSSSYCYDPQHPAPEGTEPGIGWEPPLQ